MKNELSKFFKENIIQFLGFIIVLLNLWLATKLAPLATDIALIKTQIYANNQEHDRFLTKAEFQQVVVRIDRISSRVDEIFKILVER